MIEDNFHLLHRSVRHAPPSLQNTMKVLLAHLEEERAHENGVFRGIEHPVPDYYMTGIELLQTDKMGTDTIEDEEIATELELDDILDI